MPSGDELLTKTSSRFEVFALHTHAPYVKECDVFEGHDIAPLPDHGYGFHGYMSHLCKHYPAGYKGPFTLGVHWQPSAPDIPAHV